MPALEVYGNCNHSRKETARGTEPVELVTHVRELYHYASQPQGGTLEGLPKQDYLRHAHRSVLHCAFRFDFDVGHHVGQLISHSSVTARFSTASPRFRRPLALRLCQTQLISTPSTRQPSQSYTCRVSAALYPVHVLGHQQRLALRSASQVSMSPQPRFSNAL